MSVTLKGTRGLRPSFFKLPSESDPNKLYHQLLSNDIVLQDSENATDEGALDLLIFIVVNFYPPAVPFHPGSSPSLDK